ncbi:hypothetical protein [Pararhodonellum marinum]|uniref:hypothetical protein n=1 Tax=Pararhodonellum marinum TaxID=2755358 RepID=UPI001E30BD01|nr:hypothetical protein [Pararhodonellum marinum]
MKKLISMLTAALFAVPFMVSAHPGHGEEDPQSLLHWLKNPEHSIPLVLAIAAIAYLVVRLNRNRQSKASRK